LFRERFIEQLLRHQLDEKSDFDTLAMSLFKYQVHCNKVYKEYCDVLIGSTPNKVNEIPLLPISAFKSNDVISTSLGIDKGYYFKSSGTSSAKTSKHFVSDLNWYKQNATTLFEKSYGALDQFEILALLPSYQENDQSSLIYMMNHFIKESKNLTSRFIDFDVEKLQTVLTMPAAKKRLLLGVSYALLDLAEQIELDLSETIVMETGGMKGRRKELPRPELHVLLKTKFNVDSIHSEYGMTELMSQFYSKGNGLFDIPNSVRVSIREINDPLHQIEHGKTGLIGIIDLANIDSCAFILTEDLGKIHDNGQLEILGRLDHSDIRGCNLLYHDL